MPTRRSLALAMALTAALVGSLAPGASAKGTQSLDGVRRTHFKITGIVDEPVIGDPARRLGGDLMTPERSECTSSSCDVTTLRLTLPRGVRIGRFDLVATLPRSLSARVAVYDSKGAESHSTSQTDIVANGSIACCTEDPGTYQLVITDARFEAGSYTIVVYDTGGSGQFTLDVTYQARRPDRQPGKSTRPGAAS